MMAETLVQENDLWIPSPARPLSQRQVKVCAAGQVPRGGAHSVVVITTSSIEYAGEAGALLEGGRVPAAEMKGAMSAGVYERAAAVKRHIQAAQAEGCAIPAVSDGGGRVLLAVDGSVPFATVLSVVYALGQAGFGDMLYRVDAPVTTFEGSGERAGASESVMLDARG